MSQKKFAKLSSKTFLLSPTQSAVLRRTFVLARQRQGLTWEELAKLSRVSVRTLKYRFKQGRFTSLVARNTAAALKINLPNQLAKAERMVRGKDLALLVQEYIARRPEGVRACLSSLVAVGDWLLQRSVHMGFRPALMVYSSETAPVPVKLWFDWRDTHECVYELQLLCGMYSLDWQLCQVTEGRHEVLNKPDALTAESVTRIVRWLTNKAAQTRKRPNKVL